MATQHGPQSVYDVANSSLYELLKDDKDPAQLDAELERELEQIQSRINSQLQIEIENVCLHKPIQTVQVDMNKEISELDSILEQINEASEMLQSQLRYEECCCFVYDDLVRILNKSKQQMQLR